MKTVSLDLTGMTCAACANRIEKRLNRVEGARATVNYATNRATVRAEDAITIQELIATVENAGYGAAEHVPDAPEVDPVPALARRVAVTGVCAIPVIAISMVPAWQFLGWQWVALVLTLPVMFVGGAPFHRSAWVNARHGATTMDTLVSVGTIAAFGWSVFAMLLGRAGALGLTHEFHFGLTQGDGLDNIYFEAACGIIFFVLLGRLIEARSRRLAGDSVRALLQMGAKEACVLINGVETLVDVEDVLVGDEFIVRPGDKVATDGVVVEGQSAIDASLMTGESLPVEVLVGSAVTGGTLNTHGRLVVRATRVGSDTHLASLARLVEEAQAGKASVQRLADRISGVFVPMVLVIALVVFGVWLAVGAGWTFAGQAAVAVVIIACPCALGLATPTALLVGSGRGAQLGIAIKGPEVLERVRHVSTILLDKTGTLTTGKMRVVDVWGFGVPDDQVRRLAGVAESGSEHPIAKAIADGVTGQLRDFVNHVGRGVEATVSLTDGDGASGESVLVGTPEFLADRGVALPAGIFDRLDQARAGGQTAVVVAASGRAIGVVAVADQVRDSAASAIARLKQLGIKPVLLTGDHLVAATVVAQTLGIDDVRAQVVPEQKAGVVAAEQAAGRQVAMVGDGVNDAAALAAADVGIAMGSGTEAAIAAADITLMGEDVSLAVDALRLSKATLRTIYSNLAWAFGYNIAAIPLAALGYLNPMLAGAAMAFSSVFVVLNSLRLRGFQPGR